MRRRYFEKALRPGFFRKTPGEGGFSEVSVGNFRVCRNHVTYRRLKTLQANPYAVIRPQSRRPSLLHRAVKLCFHKVVLVFGEVHRVETFEQFYLWLMFFR